MTSTLFSINALGDVISHPNTYLFLECALHNKVSQNIEVQRASREAEAGEGDQGGKRENT
jgi:hypothetical protein